MKKIYRQKINYHNINGNYPKGTLWYLNVLEQYSPNEDTVITFGNHLNKDFVENNPDIFANIFAEIVKEPLFTTEDGVDIYEGDQYYSVRGKETLVNEGKANKRWSGVASKVIEDVKYFKVKEEAKEFIDLNKLKYSKQDIYDIFELINLGSSTINVLLNELKRYKNE